MCFYGSLAAIIFWHNRFRWFTVIAVPLCTAVPLLVDSSHVYRGLHYPSADADRAMASGR